MDLSNVSGLIRWPFEIFGKVLSFVITYILEIGIIVGAILVAYALFASGVIKRISEAIIKDEEANNGNNQEVKEPLS